MGDDARMETPHEHKPGYRCDPAINAACRPAPSDPPGPYVVTELSLARLTADQVFAEKDAGRPHPEATPVGPFRSRADADAWALDQTAEYGGGSWSIAPLRLPFPAIEGKGVIEVDLRGCARCGTDEGHPGLRFHPLTFPLEEQGILVASHWAMCPTLQEPIMMAVR